MIKAVIAMPAKPTAPTPAIGPVNEDDNFAMTMKSANSYMLLL
jgi:hypothetical protein